MRSGPNGGGLSRKAILSEIDNRLKRLGMDYVDLYIIHRWDSGTPIEETMEALHDVVKADKPAISGLRQCGPGSFRKRSISRKGMAGQRSSPCSPSTTWYTAKKSGKWCPCEGYVRRPDSVQSAGCRAFVTGME